MNDQSKDQRFEALNFLFRLSFLNIGEAYTIGTDSCITDLVHFGIVYVPNKSEYFYPTRLAGYLSGPTLPQSPEYSLMEQGFLLLETSFRLYSFSNSPFHQNIISKFATLEAKLPNMSAWRIFKESVMQGYQEGLTAFDVLNVI